jgi:hypothetical protein
MPSQLIQLPTLINPNALSHADLAVAFEHLQLKFSEVVMSKQHFFEIARNQAVLIAALLDCHDAGDYVAIKYQLQKLSDYRQAQMVTKQVAPH